MVASGARQGPVTCFKAASATRRSIHTTDMFQAKHPEVARLLTHVRGWKFIATLEEYLAKYRNSRHNMSSMALLKRKSEAVRLTKHVYDADEFLQFLRNVVRAKSKMGICKRRAARTLPTPCESSRLLSARGSLSLPPPADSPAEDCLSRRPIGHREPPVGCQGDDEAPPLPGHGGALHCNWGIAPRIATGWWRDHHLPLACSPCARSLQRCVSQAVCLSRSQVEEVGTAALWPHNLAFAP